MKVGLAPNACLRVRSTLGSEGLRSAIILGRPLCPQVKGRAVKIRPKTKDWLKGLQEEIIRKRDSVASVSPTANSCLLEENCDFTSLDYDSEGESPPRTSRSVWRGGQTRPSPSTRASRALLRPPPREGSRDPWKCRLTLQARVGGPSCGRVLATCSAKTGGV